MYTPGGKLHAVGMGKADYALPVFWQCILSGILAQIKVKRVKQKFHAFAVPALWKQAGQRHLQDVIFIKDINSMDLTGQAMVFRLFYPAGGKNQMTQLTGNFFCPQRGVRRQHLIVIRIPLDISRSHSVEGI